ncbi:hypothetical protein LshimejAT787_0505290 [Lyophyllum shimeji]|uniref:Uncharacterized protein n=1 Tax=Lyophyllum shimeji TaxID=47721 RepID=A0A9P3UKZ0_LYOSH|nr:hypothetical protein LshimejAT787_0505290 [Lyophyllum shimeji]
MTFEHGQDPNEHYWLYFTTLNEEKVTLDVGMFTFNPCLCVPAQPYFEHIPVPNPPGSSAPAYFRSHEKARTVPDIVTTAQEFTVLRNTALEAAIASSSGLDWQAIDEFMGEVSGKKRSIVEQRFVKVLQ